jgi:hypothetical protein
MQKESTVTALLNPPLNAAVMPPPAAAGNPTEASFIGRFVALLTPIFVIAAGTIAGYVAKHFSGVALDQTQIVALMIAAATAALSAAWKWLQGWQQHEQLVAAGMARPRKPGPPVGA